MATQQGKTSAAVAKRTPQEELAQIFTEREAEIAKNLPPGCGMNATRFTQFALQAAKSDQLRDCTALSVYESCLESATLGLAIGGSLAHAYLVAYNCKTASGWQRRAQFQLGYRGMVELLRRSGSILRAEVRAVFKGDEFRYWFGLNPDIQHTPCGNTAESDMTHVYAVVQFSDGGKQFDVMTLDEVLLIRDRSKSKDKETGQVVGPWKTDPIEMSKKTVVRRLCKMLPMSPEVREAIERDDERTVDVRAHVVPQTKAPALPGTQSQAAITHQPQGETMPTGDAPESEHDPFLDGDAPPADQAMDPLESKAFELIDAADSPESLKQAGVKIAAFGLKNGARERAEAAYMKKRGELIGAKS